MGLGPIRCSVLGDVVSSAPSEWGIASTQLQARQLVAGTGCGHAGALAVTRRGLLPEVITEVPLPGDCPWLVERRRGEEALERLTLASAAMQA